MYTAPIGFGYDATEQSPGAPTAVKMVDVFPTRIVVEADIEEPNAFQTNGIVLVADGLAMNFCCNCNDCLSTKTNVTKTTKHVKA